MSKAREAPIAVEHDGNGHLIPADVFAQEELLKLPRRARFNCYLTLAKADPDDEHGRLLNLYMAGIGLLYDNMPTGPGTDFPTPTHLRRHILCEIGFCERIPQRDGAVKKIALSQSRDHMTLEDLRYCYELSIVYVLAWTERVLGEPVNPWELWKQEHPLPGGKP
jgi:hypothetical protein